ncbi:MAG: hypothetical protein ACQGVC_13690 [Myxococcota bacterium]
MRYLIPATLFLALFLGAAQAQAKSCSSFVEIKKYDAEGQRVLAKHVRGKVKKYFPKPEGAPATDKVPGSCKKSAKQNELHVKSSGGRMSVTQIRSNFEGKMLNETDSDEWFAKKIEEIIAAGEPVVAVLRPGRKRSDPVEITTIYMPANEADFAEIKRLEDQAEDL